MLKNTVLDELYMLLKCHLIIIQFRFLQNEKRCNFGSGSLHTRFFNTNLHFLNRISTKNKNNTVVLRIGSCTVKLKGFAPYYNPLKNK